LDENTFFTESKNEIPDTREYRRTALLTPWRAGTGAGIIHCNYPGKQDKKIGKAGILSHIPKWGPAKHGSIRHLTVRKYIYSLMDYSH
jgi:hypothetical protein